MLKTVSIFSIALLLTSPTYAKKFDYRKALYECTQLNSVKKSKCLYDLANKAREEYSTDTKPHITSKTPLKPKKNQFVNGFKVAGNWALQEKRSQLTDSRDIYASVDASNSVSCRSGLNTHRPTLMIRCMENTTAIFFSTDCFMASTDYNDSGHINYRLDKLTPGKIRAQESTNHKSLGLWRGHSSIPFIKKMEGRNSLLIRMRPYSESAFEVTFDITGINEVISDVRKACHW